MYRIEVHYLDSGNIHQTHTIKGEEWLVYRDLADAPVLVRQIAQDGLVKDHIDNDGYPHRCGVFIPAHRITAIMFEDDYGTSSIEA